MQKIAISIAFIFVTTVHSFGQVKSLDTLKMLNGQRLIGTLKGLTLGKVKFDAKDIGIVELKKTKIKTIISHYKIYRIEMTYKDIYFSSLEEGSKPGTVRIYDNINNVQKDISIIMINSFVSTSDSIKKGTLQGNFNIGYSYTKSSDIGRFNLDGNLKYMMKKFDLEFTLNSINTQKAKSWIRDRENVLTSATWYLKNDFIVSALSNYQRNLELGVLYRIQEGGLVGYKFLATYQMNSYIYVGFVINQEFSSDTTFNNQAEIPLVVTYDLYRFKKPEILISTSFKAYGNLTELGRFRQDFDFRIKWKIISDLNLQLQFYNSFDNRTSKTKNSNADFGVITSIGYIF